MNAAASLPATLEPDLTHRAKVAQDKARVLREALPWIQRWSGRTVVVKYGGNVAAPGDGVDEATLAFAADIALMQSVGVHVVVVHGGGPQISTLADRLGLTSTFVDGQRVTDEAMLEVVRLALLGHVNPWLVDLISGAGAPAVGVAGLDAGLITAVPIDPALGHVGDVGALDPGVLHGLIADGAVPVVATLGRSEQGQIYNINADRVAGAIAVALRADMLIYLTNVPGLYEHFGTDASTLLSEVGVERLRQMLEDGELHTGMVPKIASVVGALDGGVAKAHLLDGRIEHALLLEVFTDEGIGTMVVPGQGHA